MINLYDAPLSGNCHKVRLFLSLLALPHQIHPVNLRHGDQQSPDYLQLNPFGQVPVLVDDDLTIRDSQAILVYLAKRYGGEQWWPDDAYRLAQISAWLSTAANEVSQGPALLRLHHKFGRDIDVDKAKQTTDKVLGIIDHHLKDRKYLVLDSLSIADIAIYPYLALATEGGIVIDDYTHIIDWFQNLHILPGFISMPGMWQITIKN